MSEILKALKISEQHHQRYEALPSNKVSASSASRPRASRLMVVMSFILPVALTVTWLGYSANPHKNAKSSSEIQVIPDIIEVESGFTVLPHLPITTLKTTYRSEEQISIVDTIQTFPIEEEDAHAETSNTRIVGHATQKEKAEEADVLALEHLSELDLSQFSPEIAFRVQSVLSNEKGGSPSTEAFSANTQDTSSQGLSISSVKLVQSGADFQGLLPAMNFQTHVYSSQVDKRWVKINGSEFVEGDKINDLVTLVEIKQRYCMINYEGQLIEIPALYDWKG
ncbi:general secretion pathway protein GspB [Vibrio sp. YMD68]|uniref:general secretion pathway protein GspB n=1 Tax=Vibrio sp. YMD68 TaxID=3042300 RepID=UPI00249C0335|nr:general secretion pathway protein GspB [Vibrio sp. YMD68]WGW00784.1 general secretion pathway protein GspB [Vibrio sp. YMD68]